MGHIRDAQRTRAALLDAARDEFAEHGYAGARIDRIASRAGVRKQLFYQYFKSKEAVFEQILDSVEEARTFAQFSAPDPASLFRARFELSNTEVVWLRLVAWEAAAHLPRAPILNETRRTEAIARQIGRLEQMQEEGTLDERWNPCLVQLAMYALVTYPQTFSQITRMVTGLDADDPEFQRQWATFLEQLGSLL
jgi:AcrR family transcriptional regulator